MAAMMRKLLPYSVWARWFVFKTRLRMRIENARWGLAKAVAPVPQIEIQTVTKYVHLDTYHNERGLKRAVEQMEAAGLIHEANLVRSVIWLFKNNSMTNGFGAIHPWDRFDLPYPRPALDSEVDAAEIRRISVERRARKEKASAEKAKRYRPIGGDNVGNHS